MLRVNYFKVPLDGLLKGLWLLSGCNYPTKETAMDAFNTLRDAEIRDETLHSVIDKCDYKVRHVHVTET